MKPNILHLFVDQQRFDTIAALGNPIIKTPNLDRLVHQGVAFTSAYTPSPVCIAARCSMIYGQYPIHTGCYENTTMPQRSGTLMDALSQAGYDTYGIGKCHFTPDSAALRGFRAREHQEDYMREPGEAYYEYLRDQGYGYISEPAGVRGEMYYIPQVSQLPARLHPSAWIGDRSIAYLESRKNNDQPWYLFSSFVQPHPPFCPPAPWHKLYRAALMPLPKVPQDTPSLQTFLNRIQNRSKYRDHGVDQNLIRVMKAYYYASISFVDYQIGRILDALEASGMADQTLIVFSSDHGELLGDYNSVGKRSYHDSSARIPMILSMKDRFEGGKICDTPVSLVDLAPTFLGAAGVTDSGLALDGEDLYQIASGASSRRMIFGQHSYPIPHRPAIADPEMNWAAMASYMAVTPEWKYFYSAGDQAEFLFNRRTDPLETRNLAGVPFVRKEQTALREAVINELRQAGVTAGLDGDGFRAFPPYELHQNPDAEMMVQDKYLPWSENELNLPGYDL